jgi:hypothetical protein
LGKISWFLNPSLYGSLLIKKRQSWALVLRYSLCPKEQKEQYEDEGGGDGEGKGKGGSGKWQ